MKGPRGVWVLGAAAALGLAGFLIAQELQQDQIPVEHPECSYFGPQRERFVTDALQKMGGGRSRHTLSTMTEQVAHALGAPSGSAARAQDKTYPTGSIDAYIWADFQKNGITPAPPTTDWEFKIGRAHV